MVCNGQQSLEIKFDMIVTNSFKPSSMPPGPKDQRFNYINRTSLSNFFLTFYDNSKKKGLRINSA